MRSKAVAKVFVSALLVIGMAVALIGACEVIKTGSQLAKPDASPSSGPSSQPAFSPESTNVLKPWPTLQETELPTVVPSPIETPVATATSLPTPIPTWEPVVARASNWAGYIVSSDLNLPQSSVTSVTASWIVPAVAPSVNDTYSAVWIGVGGQFDRTPIQCGTRQDSINGQASYSAWYEMLPRSVVQVRSISVSPGDQIQASIQLVGKAFNLWSFQLSDLTTGHSFQNNFTYLSTRLSADWILERPTVNNALSTLSDFGTMTFTNCQATMGNESGTINSFPAIETIMYSAINNGTKLTDVSSVSSDGASFSVTYLPP